MSGNILSVDVEDWFHILETKGSPDIDSWAALESRVERNHLRLLDEFDEAGARATCFFLGWVAERHPGLVKETIARGHEVASHGYAHQLIYTLTREAFAADLRRSKAFLEDLTGQPVEGYRAPGFSIVASVPWAVEEIAKAGFSYDSSIFPAKRGHGGLAHAELAPHVIHTESGPLVEFPITVLPVLGRRLCLFGGGYLRLFPYPSIKAASARVRASGRPVICYVHPREIDPDHPRMAMSAVRRFKSYVNLSTTRPKLRAFLRDFRFTSFRDHINEAPVQAAT